MEEGNQMDMDCSIVQGEKEEQETLEQPTKQSCIKASSSTEEDSAPSLDEENVVEDTDASDEEEEDEEEDNDTDSSDEYEYVPPRRFMTDEETCEYRRQVAASKGFDVAAFEGKLPGAIQPYILVESTRLPLIDLSKQALQVYNENNNTRFEFDSLVKANAQVVAGMMFYITFEAHSGNIRGTFRARVWKKIMNRGSQVMSCEKHEL